MTLQNKPEFISFKTTLLDKNPQIIFNEIGGIGLGLSMAQRLSEVLPEITTPPYVAIVKDGANFQNELQPFLGKKVVVKCSTQIGDFTNNSYRGLFSTSKSPRYEITTETNFADLTAHIEHERKVETTAYILQEFLAPTDAIHTLCHIDKSELLFEMIHSSGRCLYAADTTTGEIRSRERSSKGASLEEIESRFNIPKLIAIQKSIAEITRFPVNVEGFYNGSNYQIVQMRSIPVDAVHAHTQQSKSCHGFETRLVKGEFAVEGQVISTKAANENYEQREPLIVLRTEDKLPWEEAYFLNRAKKSLETIVIDTVNASVIAHSPNDIPMDLDLRAKLKRIGALDINAENILGRQVNIKSDGMRGCIIL